MALEKDFRFHFNDFLCGLKRIGEWIKVAAINLLLHMFIESKQEEEQDTMDGLTFFSFWQIKHYEINEKAFA